MHLQDVEDKSIHAGWKSAFVGEQSVPPISKCVVCLYKEKLCETDRGTQVDWLKLVAMLKATQGDGRVVMACIVLMQLCAGDWKPFGALRKHTAHCYRSP